MRATKIPDSLPLVRISPTRFAAVLGICACVVHVVQATLHAADTAAVESAFREAVSLWADERFETLWERADTVTRQALPKEQFVFRMRDRALKPACCFRQVQELTVRFLGSEEALVKVKMGFESRTRGTTFDAVLNFSLRNEEGEWRVAARDFLRLPDETLHRLFIAPPPSTPR